MLDTQKDKIKRVVLGTQQDKVKKSGVRHSLGYNKEEWCQALVRKK